MKKLMVILAAVLFLAGYTADAQMHPDNQGMMQGGMMQGGMMQGNMMQDNMMCPMCGQMMTGQMPMKKYMMMVNMLPSMQDQLSLSTDQTGQLLDMQTEFKKQQLDFKADLMKNQMKLKEMLSNDASSDELKDQMQKCSDIKINMKLAAYETANNMKNVLTAEQKDQLKNMMMHQNNRMNKNQMMDQNRMNMNQ